MLNQFGVWYLVGIVSAGYSCAKQYQPGIYHRVSVQNEIVQDKSLGCRELAEKGSASVICLKRRYVVAAAAARVVVGSGILNATTTR